MALQSGSNLSRADSRLRFRVGLFAVTLLTGAAALYFIDPARYPSMPLCVFHGLTGFYCPGCGSSRAAHQLLHGNIPAALAYNSLMVVALPFVCYAVLAHAVFAISHRALPAPRRKAGYVWALLAIIVAYWVVRNIPVYPLTILVPHALAE